VVQALCQLEVPQSVPLEGSISYADLSAKVGVAQDRLQHLIRNAAVCSNYLRETENGEVAHSPNSAIWQLDPMMANGMEVMLNHLPSSSFQLGEVCTRDPTDEQERVDGFSLARGAPLFEYLETNPDQGRRFAAHMRAQAAQSGDEAIQECYDWDSIKGKTLVDVSTRSQPPSDSLLTLSQCGGSFGSVATAIVRKAPGVRCIVQDLPKVINSAIAVTSKNPNFPHDSVSFQAHSFLEPQPVVADLYLFRMVFHNWCDQGARRIIRALLPVLRPGARVVAIEYVMPKIGSAPIYAEVATRRLDNVMYSLMKGKVRELEEFKDLFHSVEPNLKFKSFRQGALKATHDPKCHSVLEWVYDPEPTVPVTNSEAPPAPVLDVPAPLQVTISETATPVLNVNSENSTPVLSIDSNDSSPVSIEEPVSISVRHEVKSAVATVQEVSPISDDAVEVPSLAPIAT
jgi:6-hydroxytryprostatin B O-methyltransferase